MSQALTYPAAARCGKGGAHRYVVRRAAFVPKQLEMVRCGMEHMSMYPRLAATDSDAEKSHAFYVTKSALNCSSATNYKLRFHFLAERLGATSEAIIFTNEMIDECQLN